MTNTNWNWAGRAGALLLLCLGSGCSGNGEPVRSNTQGKISYLGQPLTTGMLTFHPDGGGMPINCSISRDGAYRMTEALVGTYRVTVHTPPKPPPGRKASARPSAPEPVYVPEKYKDPAKSNLTVAVSEKDSQVDIAIENP